MEKRPRTLPDEIVRAIYRNDFQKITEWQSEKTINSLDRDKRTIIFHAVLNASKELVIELLKNKPYLNVKDYAGWSPLHYATQNYLIDIAEFLINSGADIELKDDYGNTPLWRATFSSQGKGEMIHLLLSKGADPNNSNNSGISPIKLASTIANYDIKNFFNAGE